MDFCVVFASKYRRSQRLTCETVSKVRFYLFLSSQIISHAHIIRCKLLCNQFVSYHQVERIFELLNRAEIEFSLKEKIYAIAQKKGSRNDAYLLDQLTLLNAPEDVFGAVKEILTALD